MAHEKIVTMFSTLAQAEGAKRSLIKAGFAEHDIDVISGERLKSEGHEARHPGFWQRLFGSTVDEEQSGVYEDAINSGSVVLTLRANEDQLPRAYSVLDAHDTGELPTGSGLGQDDGYTVSAAHSAPGVNSVGDSGVTEPVRTSLTGDESEEEVLRLAEERLEVGKRLVSEGTTRVRRYTVTDQVSEDISLQEQHADIFRRSTGDLAAADNVDWEEKTIEVAETHEQPVINKTAHIKEEVVVRKDQSERVENITDSVRRQEVDIDHADTNLAADAPLTGGATARTAGTPGTLNQTAGTSGALNETDADGRIVERSGVAGVEEKDNVDPLLKRP
ncbi:YsnF/AvaK domain-containing protein [Pantoea piersonii]|uniref:YsnF/AvaK domain-containing protein n=1 Tax=Pantoea piersonii TaxID=2364647 RepID=UPI0022F1AFEE|nr:YsnF/AvaK domain-containing protein [Pantoea piersonii]WBV23717.1 YsnF/AvaK domain-containing protein [Pantoea piersonii]